MSDDDQFIQSAYQFIMEHELKAIIIANYLCGPPTDKGYIWYNWKEDDELGDVHKTAHEVMETMILNAGYDSGASFACAQRRIQSMVHDRFSMFLFGYNKI